MIIDRSGNFLLVNHLGDWNPSLLSILRCIFKIAAKFKRLKPETVYWKTCSFSADPLRIDPLTFDCTGNYLHELHPHYTLKNRNLSAK
jgi:hypothetical protein